MTAVLGRAAVAPVLADSNPRAEQVTQLLCGEGALVLEMAGDWLRLQLRRDRYEGWVHRGFLFQLQETEADRWDETALWSAGATVSIEGDGGTLRLDPGARVARADDGSLRLSDGRRALLVEGAAAPRQEIVAAARRTPPEAWAFDHFTGTPYQWGGLTPRGVDCSGLVQMTFHLRGIPLPRDAREQVEHGRPVERHEIAPSDLLFFAEEDGRISHVAFAAQGDGLIHSTIACGGVVRESWEPGSRAAPLRERLAAVRRLAR